MTGVSLQIIGHGLATQHTELTQLLNLETDATGFLPQLTAKIGLCVNYRIKTKDTSLSF